MAISQNNLKNWIAYLSYYYAKFGAKLRKKYIYGATACKEDEKKLMIASWYLEEIELYYNGCSCLEEADICKMIVTVKQLVK
jgi:hypothetical protein